jgi:endonuclease YncB( thermonuclease family)
MLNKKQKNILLGITILAISIIGIFFSSNDSTKLVKDARIISPSPEVSQNYNFIKKNNSNSPVPTAIISQVFDEEGEIGNESTEEQNSISQKTYPVVKVVDGDTLDVNIDGKTERLRLIGIDTPETVDPRKSVQCFGVEASNKAKELLLGQNVGLEADESQGERDKYKRLLRYVFLPDGTNFNLFMIAEGYAHEYTYGESYKYQSEFKQAQIEARNNQKGLWSAETCSGNK